MDAIRKHMSQVSEGMTLLDEADIVMFISVLKIVRKRGGTVYLMGNGGSHTTASHFANDLIKMGRVRALCLGDEIASVTAYGNDEGWENMYLKLLGKMMKYGDGVVGISCSGNSENVVRGMRNAVAESGVLVMGLTGNSLDSRINLFGLDALVHARVPDIRVQEDLHLMVCHAIARSLQESEE